MRILFSVILFCLLFFGFANAQSVQENYINLYRNIAVSEMHRSGVPASITLAQGILESSSGTSMLSVKGNNHFGIKCHSDWTGKKIYKDDDAKNECFRVYASPEGSFRDHSDFLRNNTRYASLFDLEITNYKAWAEGLKKAGYATNPMYASMLIDIIERYNLSVYDTYPNVPVAETPIAEASTATSQPKEQKPVVYYTSNSFELSGSKELKHASNNNTEYVVPNYNTNVKDLAESLELMPWQIAKYNDMPKDARISAGEVIYIKPKRSKAAKGTTKHVVKQGETMRDVSQLYAVKLKSLYKINGWEYGAEPVVGSKIALR